VTFQIGRVPDYESQSASRWCAVTAAWFLTSQFGRCDVTRADALLCSFDIVLWIPCNPMLLSLRWLSKVHYIACTLFMATKSLQKIECFLSLFLRQISGFAPNLKKLVSHNIYSLHCCKTLKRHGQELYIGCYKRSEVIWLKMQLSESFGPLTPMFQRAMNDCNCLNKR
jgi:hypothetical protein